MNNIIERQNQPEYIRLLKAQRIAYSLAKKYQMGFETIALIVAMTLPIIYIFIPEYKTIIGSIGALLSIIALIIDRVQKHITKEAASIQEQFDRGLFELDWDQYNGAKKVSPEKIISYSKKYDKTDIFNWYSENITANIPQNIAVLLCQKANIHWDNTLRKKYRLLIIILGLVFVGLMITAIALQFSRTSDFFCQSFLLLVGSAAFIKYCWSVIADKTDIIREKKDLGEKLDKCIAEFKTSKIEPSKEDLARIQTAIFNSRKKGVKVPDWFHIWHREKQENEMNEMTRIIRDEQLGLK
jgi:hypothetical protein